MTYRERMAACPCLCIRKTSKVMTAMFNDRLAPSGVLITQLPVLGALQTEGTLPLVRLSEVLDMDRTTLSRNINPLLRGGLVREGTGRDKRQRMLGITAKGSAALKMALPLWDTAQSEVKTVLGDAETADLLTDLRDLAKVSS